MNLRNKKFATVAEYDNYIEGNYPKPNVSYIVEGGVIKYQKDAPTPAKEQYLTFTALEDGTFQISDVGKSNTIDYSLDGGTTWTTLSAATNTPTVTAGSKIMWKGTLSTTYTTGIGTFISTGSFDVEGNAMSLLFGDNFKNQMSLYNKNRAFKALFKDSHVVNAKRLALPATDIRDEVYSNMFEGCVSLISAPKLPALKVYYSAYSNMFNGCTSLTTAPALPATELVQSCYNGMFSGCTSLTTAPELPATTLAIYVYQNMFAGCSSLNYIKMLATDTSPTRCLNNWVKGVSATGTFTKATGVTIPTGNSGIPSGWTVIEE